MNNNVSPKIGGISESSGSSAYSISETSERKEQGKPQQTEKTHAKVSDSVEISDTARLLLAVKQEIGMIEKSEKAGFSEEQQKKINELKEQIHSGTYQVDAKQIAKNILMEEHDINK